ncbi:MAG: hypothetical protein N3E51_01200 [Candidatus Micrarchaeota archaeon]|nr:hypothetical protein [Candidatus Micrarchaeota archaeon]
MGKQMGQLALAFSLLLLFQPAFCAQAPIERFANLTFEPDQQVSFHFLLPQRTHAIVKADGAEIYVIEAVSGKTLREAKEIEALLVEDAKSRTKLEAILSSALSFPDEVSSAKAEAEKKCMQYTGTDLHDCTDKHSCILSCMSVPLCSTPLYSDGFWEAILDWTTSRKAFDAAIGEYRMQLNALLSNASSIESAEAVLMRLEALSLNMSANPIFLNRTDEGCAAGGTVRCFEFCQKIDYSASRIRQEKQNLALLKAALSEIASQQSRAKAIAEASRRQDEYVSSRGRDFEKLRIRTLSEAKKLRERAEKLSGKVEDGQLEMQLAELENLSRQIALLGKSSLYRQAFSAESSFNQKHSEVSARIEQDEKAHNEAQKLLSDISNQLERSSWLLDDSSKSKYAAILADYSKNLSSPQTPKQLSEAREGMRLLKSQLSEEIAERAASQQPQLSPPGAASGDSRQSAEAAPAVPCLPGLFILLALFAQPRRSYGK